MFPTNFNFSSREWADIKAKLESDLSREIDKLCNPSCSHDESNQIRGRIRYIKEFLHTQAAAAKGNLARPQ